MLLLHKILPLLILPSGLALLSLLLGLVLRKRFFFYLSFVLLVLFSMPLVSNGLMRAVEGVSVRSPAGAARKADAIVVLSGMISQVEGAPLGEWSEGADRFEGGIELFRAGKAPLLVFTRGQIPWEKESVPEGELLRERALLLGIPQKRILLTDKAGNTAEEATAVKHLLGGGAARKRILLVTSAYHLRRAVLLFERAGFEVEPFRVDIQTPQRNRMTVLDLLPNSEALMKSETAVREMIGYLYYRSKG